MKKSELRKMIKEEMNSKNYKFADGQVNIKAKKAFLESAETMYDDLIDQGFEEEDAMDFLYAVLKREF